MNRTRLQMQLDIFLQRRNIYTSGIFNYLHVATDLQLEVTCYINIQHLLSYIAKLELVAHMSFEYMYLAGGWAK